jgi:hypothetical protein
MPIRGGQVAPREAVARRIVACDSWVISARRRPMGGRPKRRLMLWWCWTENRHTDADIHVRVVDCLGARAG